MLHVGHVSLSLSLCVYLFVSRFVVWLQLFKGWMATLAYRYSIGWFLFKRLNRESIVIYII